LHFGICAFLQRKFTIFSLFKLVFLCKELKLYDIFEQFPVLWRRSFLPKKPLFLPSGLKRRIFKDSRPVCRFPGIRHAEKLPHGYKNPAPGQ
jgi:hypothetical protein